MTKENENRPQEWTLEGITRIAIDNALRDGMHIPTLIVEGNRATVLLQVRKVPPTHEARIVQMFSLGFSLAQTGDVGLLTQVFFVTEAWMSIGDGKELPVHRPSQDPNRREVLLISSYQPTGRTADGTLAEMLRDRAGKLVELKPLEQPEQSQVESPLLVAFAEGFRRGMS